MAYLRGQIIMRGEKYIRPEAENKILGFCQEKPLWGFLKRLVLSNFWGGGRGCCKFFKNGGGPPRLDAYGLVPFGRKIVKLKNAFASIFFKAFMYHPCQLYWAMFWLLTHMHWWYSRWKKQIKPSFLSFWLVAAWQLKMQHLWIEFYCKTMLPKFPLKKYLLSTAKCPTCPNQQAIVMEFLSLSHAFWLVGATARDQFKHHEKCMPKGRNVNQRINKTKRDYYYRFFLATEVLKKFLSQYRLNKELAMTLLNAT